MSSGSSSGYGSAGTAVDTETVTSSVPLITHVINVRSPVCSMSYYPSNRASTSSDPFLSNSSTRQQSAPPLPPPPPQSDDPNQSQPDAELLPSISDFQFPAAMNGMWGEPRLMQICGTRHQRMQIINFCKHRQIMIRTAIVCNLNLLKFSFKF